MKAKKRGNYGDDTFKVDHESEVKYWAEWCLPLRASPGHPTTQAMLTEIR
jgi:hypothetical protein